MTQPVVNPGTRQRRGVVVTLTAVALAGAVLGAVLFYRYGTRAAAESGRVAVAPFDVFVPGLERWRVALAEALTRRLASAVPQSVVAERWQASSHPAVAAVELARQTRAGVAVYGRIDPAPHDSLVARLAVMDAVAAQLLFEVTVRDKATSPERLADSLAAGIRRGLGRP